MPAPTNISAATAIDVGPLPVVGYTQTVDFGGSTFDVWHKFTATQTGVARWFGFGDLTVYKPFTLPYLGPDTAPVQYIVSETQNRYVQFPVVSGTTYYIRSRKNADVSPSVLHIDASYFAETTPVPTGSIAVNDDKDGFPLALVNHTNATNILKFLQPFPAGEQGEILDNGILLVEDISGVLTNDVIVKMFDSNYNLTLTNDFLSGDGWQRTFIGSNKTNKFYLGWNADYDNFTGQPSFRTITSGGTVSGFTALDGDSLQGLAPNNAETILYYSGKSGTNRPIKRWDLVNNIGLSDLAADVAGYNPKDILVSSNDSVIVLYYNPITLDTNVLIYNTSGTLLITVAYGTQIDPRIFHAIDHTTFWSMMHPASGGLVTGAVVFTNVKVSDGSTVSTTTGSIVEHGAYAGPVTAIPPTFSVSQSCPAWITRTEFPFSGTTGTIIVTKYTNPSSDITEFNFTSSGGLSPISFSLSNGQSQEFDDVPVGSGYGISEDTPAGYSTEYAVSNASPIDNISVGVGETVTITVTNTKLVAPLSGIYKIVPNKTNDTLWTNLTSKSTVDVKIPDPFAKTALVGE